MLSYRDAVMAGFIILATAAFTLALVQQYRHNKEALKSFVIGVVALLTAIAFAFKK